jgi:hypothetical protein
MFSVCVVSLGAVGCATTVRDADWFEKDTTALLETKNADIKKCYDEALKSDPKMGGNVTVKFKIQVDTGKVIDPAVDPAQTTAPAPLGDCVVNSLNGLVLAPPDNGHDGVASYTYEFKANPQKQAPAPAAPSGPGGPPAKPAG